jgi:hypothetical protein
MNYNYYTVLRLRFKFGSEKEYDINRKYMNLVPIHEILQRKSTGLIRKNRWRDLMNGVTLHCGTRPVPCNTVSPGLLLINPTIHYF